MGHRSHFKNFSGEGLRTKKETKKGKKLIKTRKKRSILVKKNTLKQRIKPEEFLYHKARNTWEFAKSIRLYAENDDEVVEVLVGNLKSKNE